MRGWEQKNEDSSSSSGRCGGTRVDKKYNFSEFLKENPRIEEREEEQLVTESQNFLYGIAKAKAKTVVSSPVEV